MALAYTYSDAYVAAKITTDREARAIAEVAQLGTLPDTWVKRLGIIRAYIITCLECASAPDDMWTTKLSAYRKEFDTALPQARGAQSLVESASATTDTTSRSFTCDLLRG
jgi:hypothetical protein